MLAYLNALSDSMLAVHGYADRAFLAISGYDGDQREIYEIPECKVFFRALVPKVYECRAMSESALKKTSLDAMAAVKRVLAFTEHRRYIYFIRAKRADPPHGCNGCRVAHDLL